MKKYILLILMLFSCEFIFSQSKIYYGQVTGALIESDNKIIQYDSLDEYYNVRIKIDSTGLYYEYRGQTNIAIDLIDGTPSLFFGDDRGEKYIVKCELISCVTLFKTNIPSADFDIQYNMSVEILSRKTNQILLTYFLLTRHKLN